MGLLRDLCRMGCFEIYVGWEDPCRMGDDGEEKPGDHGGGTEPMKEADSVARSDGDGGGGGDKGGNCHGELLETQVGKDRTKEGRLVQFLGRWRTRSGRGGGGRRWLEGGGLQIEVEIWPERRLWVTSSCSRLSIHPMESGRGPTSLLKLTSKTMRSLRRPISRGRQDRRPLLKDDLIEGLGHVAEAGREASPKAVIAEDDDRDGGEGGLGFDLSEGGGGEDCDGICRRWRGGSGWTGLPSIAEGNAIWAYSISAHHVQY